MSVTYVHIADDILKQGILFNSSNSTLLSGGFFSNAISLISTLFVIFCISLFLFTREKMFLFFSKRHFFPAFLQTAT